MKIGLVRRGFSGSGGAEAYLKRFAGALREAGHDCVLFASEEWPDSEWPFGELRRVRGGSPRSFADALSAANPRAHCDFLFSLERVWSCDCYRAGDGVHRAWLERRKRYEPWWSSAFRALRSKHRELLELEKALFRPAATRLVLANSNLVRDEIVREFGYPADRIRVIYNGVPAPRGTWNADLRQKARQELGVDESAFVVLFAGSGWERKGLKFAILGVNAANIPNLIFLVAGRGKQASLPASRHTRFLGPVRDMETVFAASDLFLLPTLYDPFSNACLEAAVRGMPVITTLDNGFSEVIEPGKTGEVLMTPTDTLRLAAAIEQWTNQEKRSAARSRAAHLASKFDIETNLRATLDAINETRG